MSIETAIDINVETAIERGDFQKALRMRWLSHANYSATLDTDYMFMWMHELRLAPENVDMEVCNNMDTKIFIRYVWIDNYYEREKVRDMLNGLGFYVLRVQDGLEVNAIRSTPTGLVEWFKELVG